MPKTVTFDLGDGEELLALVGDNKNFMFGNAENLRKITQRSNGICVAFILLSM